MASLEKRELAYANAVEITREQTAWGFVPNFACGNGSTSEDRSQPPVGSAMVLEIYRRYGEKWLLEMLYPVLREWNAWYYEHRRSEDTGEFSHRVSPTLLYAPFDPEVPVQRARRMADEHDYNPRELYGEWMIPTIARNDPAYPDQDYWRGRCWPSTNFLAYSAIRSHGTLPDVQKDLAEHSVKLMMKEWTENRHIHENYNADTGEGCDVPNSDKFYHWGALLGLIGMLESGAIPDSMAPLA